MTKQKRLVDPIFFVTAAFVVCSITPAILIIMFADCLIPYIENASALHLINVLGGNDCCSLFD